MTSAEYMEGVNMSYKSEDSCSEASPITSQRRRKITLLIFGKTGSGISSTGNTILSKNAFRVRASMVPSRDTSYICDETSEDGEDIRVITVTDLLTLTPESREHYVTELKCKLKKEKISAVLMTIRADNRFTDDQYELYSMMKGRLEKEDILSKLIVVFTASSGFDDDTLDSASGTLRTIISDAKQRCVFIDNKASNYRKAVQVCRLLTTVDRLTGSEAEERTLTRWRVFILRMKDLLWCLLRSTSYQNYLLLLLCGIILFNIIYFSTYDRGHSLNEGEANVTKYIQWGANTTEQNYTNYVGHSLNEGEANVTKYIQWGVNTTEQNYTNYVT